MFFFPRKSICRFAGANKRSENYQYPIRAARHCKMELCKSAVSRSRGRRRKFRSYQNSTSVLGALQSGQGRVQEGEDQIQGAANCGQGRAQSLVGVNLKLVPEKCRIRRTPREFSERSRRSLRICAALFQFWCLQDRISCEFNMKSAGVFLESRWGVTLL